MLKTLSFAITMSLINAIELQKSCCTACTDDLDKDLKYIN